MQEFATLAKTTSAKLGKLAASLLRCRRVLPRGEHDRAMLSRAPHRHLLGKCSGKQVCVILILQDHIALALHQADQIVLVLREGGLRKRALCWQQRHPDLAIETEGKINEAGGNDF